MEQTDSPSVRPQAAARVPGVPSPREEATEPAHTGTLRRPPPAFPCPSLHADCSLCTYPLPRERHGSSRGPMEPGFNPSSLLGQVGRQLICPPSSQQHHTTSECGEEASLCTHPGLTMSLGGGVGSPELVLLTLTPNRTPPGDAPETYLPVHPSGSDHPISKQGQQIREIQS